MTWKVAIDLASLKEQHRQTATIDGHDILFIWHDEEVHAVQAKCPHFKLPLLKGTINKQCELVCPFHKSAFNLDTGEVKCWSPWPKGVGLLLGKLSKPKPLRIYPTRVENGDIFVQLD